MKHNPRWSYRFQLPDEVRTALNEACAAEATVNPHSLHDWKFCSSGYWGAFVGDDIWFGIKDRLYRLKKSSGRLLNTIIVPERFTDGFAAYSVIPLRAQGESLLVLGVYGIIKGAIDKTRVLLPIVLNYEMPVASFQVLDALDAERAMGETNWELHLPGLNRPEHEPCAIEECLRKPHDFVVLDLMNILDQERLSLGTRRMVAQTRFVSTDNGHAAALASRGPLAGFSMPDLLCKEIQVENERILVDFHEKTHVSFHYCRG